ncbi:alginate export family protein [Aestuariibaculum lutulentum]|uniref:Alginate export family protein n=1 Tax=Aestuariibaculum lutulentum TaxID=2920935 RepID=A0ABS9RMC7_9FLAO|nr:alginate export family protein [Aestuariibaculum lutulentum]MCH4554106.1 alginate export family protein [Aestuariibaculum lutulentum]
MKNFIAILFTGVVMTCYAQEFEISAELRPRYEYRHGYKTLIPNDAEAANFISQRTRLNLKFTSEKIQAFAALQNIRVWGDIATLSASDKNGTAVHEAWAKLYLTSNFFLKLGRQEIVYDDQRIFGNVDWAQQARSHDALIASFKGTNNGHLDFGFALSSEEESLFKTNYEVNNYKNFQYLWYHNQLKNTSISLLFLNQGLNYTDNLEQKISYNQTIGARLTYNKDSFGTDASAYLQTGKIASSHLSAYNIAANVYYDFTNHFNLAIGFEYLSGTNNNSNASKISSFNPWYGTNHKFNGLMDYFYVGNHINSVGLTDINACLFFHKNKFSGKLMPHIFSAAAKVFDDSGNEMNQSLGTELDLVFTYNWIKNVNFQFGYSQLFATNTMSILKGGNNNATNNWAWFMITIKPTLFKN